MGFNPTHNIVPGDLVTIVKITSYALDGYALAEYTKLIGRTAEVVGKDGRFYRLKRPRDFGMNTGLLLLREEIAWTGNAVST